MAIFSGTFDTIDATKAHSLIETETWWEENDKFYDGDHWQDGNGIADTLPPPSHFTTQTVKTGLARIFTAENHIAEVTDRRTDGVTSLFPQISATSPALQEKANESIRLAGMRGSLETMPDLEDENRRILKIRSALDKWFKDNGVLDILAEAIKLGCLHDRATFRILVAEDDFISASTPEEALNAITVEVLRADQSRQVEDQRTKRKCMIYAFDQENDDPKDPQRDNNNSITQLAEITYLDSKTGMTRLKVVGSDGTKDEASIPLRGCLTMHQIDGLLLIGETVRTQQRAVNTTRTHMVHHNKATDFQQRIFLNAQPLGTTVLDPETGEEIVVAEDNTRQPDTDLYLTGIEEETVDGVRIKDPKVIFHDPTSVQRFLDSEGQSRRGIYRDCNQLHVELSDDATSTGEARIQAMSDYHKDLGRVKRKLDKAGRWMLKTVWAMAEYLAGEEVSDDIHFKFSSVITIGQIDTDSRRTLVEETNAGLISRESAMSERGIEDSVMELQRLEGDPLYRLKIAERIANVVQTLTTAGSSLRGAAGLAGLTEDQIQSLIEVGDGELAPEPFSPNGQEVGDGVPELDG